MIFRRILVFGGAALAVAAVAQEAQIQQARQFETQPTQLHAATQTSVPTSLVGTGGSDTESFGVQQILRENERQRLFRAFAETSAFFTNNVALSNRDRHSDSFLVASFGLDYRRPLSHGFQLEAGAKVALFRYNEFSRLDFTSIDAGLGLSYHTAKLGGADLFLRYNYNTLISRVTEDTFFTNHTITLGAQKTVAFSQAHYAYLGLAGELGLGDPKESERSDVNVFAGYHLQATRKLEADLLYSYAYFLYSEGGRRDHNHTIAAGLRYRFTQWFSAFGSVYGVLNRSNRDPFDYDALNAGGGLTLNLQF